MQSNTIYERIIELKDFDENIKNIRDNTDQLDEGNEKYCAFENASVAATGFLLVSL